MDNVLVDFPYALARTDDEVIARHEGEADNIPGIFGRMPPIAGAVEAFEELAELFDTYVLSTAPWDNPSAWSDKLGWVKSHLGELGDRRLILSHHKNLLLGDYLIDDRTKRGADKFVGVHIHFASDPRFMDWPSVMAYLRTQVG
jgi:5'(3')-deoxyribonucleotidase